MASVPEFVLSPNFIAMLQTATRVGAKGKGTCICRTKG